jgi:hypothetical protein
MSSGGSWMCEGGFFLCVRLWRLIIGWNRLHQPNHSHTMMGRALHSAIVSSRINDKFQEALYLALELSRAGVLHGDLWSGVAYSGGPMFGAREYTDWRPGEY